MDKLNFYTVDLDYVNFLKQAEHDKRGLSRIPNMEYSDKHKPKFLCGIVLQVHNNDYYVPVTSYKQQKPDNFLIKADNGQVVSSLRFNYMFPIPQGLVSVRSIAGEPDRAYRALLSQELRYCIKNQEVIQHLAERTYKRVLLGKDQGLVVNSCDFSLLETKCAEYTAMQEKKTELTAKPPAPEQPAKLSMKDRFAAAQAEADRRAAAHSDPPQQKGKTDLEH
jgi:protein AbiQ